MLARKLVNKVNMLLNGIYFLIACKESKGIGPKKNPDPDLIRDIPSKKSKRIVFIRHGESDWNDVFNKGFNASFFGRLFNALAREVKLLTTDDSVFFDSPLNADGFEQAQELSRFLEDPKQVKTTSAIDEVISIIKGSSTDSSVIVSSNLRRAISTTTVALWPRLKRTGEKIIISSYLQEISRNIDTQSLASSGELPELGRISEFCEKEAFVPSKVYDPSENHGNKTISFYGIQRLQKFNTWAFSRPEDTIIIGGHSLWFKSFFQTYLPHSSDHQAKKLKIVNSGVVSFTLHRAEDDKSGAPMYRINPESVTTIYGGFK